MEKDLGYKSNVVIAGSNFEERIFIKVPNKGILLLMENLSSSTSTVGLMQKFDPVLTEKIIHFLKGNMSYNFVSGIENTNLHLEVRN